MAIALTDLLKPLDKKQLLADIYQLLGLAGLTTTAMQPTEPIPVVIGTFVEWVCDEFWNPLVLPALRAPFLDFASGPWLSIIADLVYNRPRFLSIPATGTVTIENHGAFTGTIAPGQVQIRNTVTGKTYNNATPIILVPWAGSGPYPSDDATFVCTQGGTVGNAQVGDISVTPSVAPVNVFAVTNASPLLGQDEESDASLKERCRTAIAEGVAGGPKDSYISAARDPVGAFVRRGKDYPPTWTDVAVAINRVSIRELGGASVAVDLASAAGAAAGAINIPDSDVYKANAAIQAFCVPPGITCVVASAVEILIPIGAVTLYVDRATPGITVAQAEQNASDALDAFFSDLYIGGAQKVAGGTGYVYGEKIEAILNAPGYVIGNNYAPSDTAMFPYNVAVPAYSITAILVTQS